MQNEDLDKPKQGGLNLPSLLIGALRYVWIPAVLATIGFLYAGIKAVALKDEYVSRGSLFVRPGVRSQLTPESAVAQAGSGAMSTRDAVEDEMQLLASPELYKIAAEIIGVEVILGSSTREVQVGGLKGSLQELSAWLDTLLTVDEQAVPGAGESFQLDLAARILSQAARFNPVSRSSVISVVSVAESPAEAKAYTDALLEAAIEFHARVNESMGSLSRVEAELETSELLARQAEMQRDDFLRSNNIFDFDAEKGALVEYRSTLLSQVDETRQSLRTYQAEEKLQDSLLKVLEPTISIPGSGEYTLNPQIEILGSVVEQLKLSRSQLEVEHAKLAISAGEYRERRKVLESQLEEANKRLDSEALQVKLPDSLQENPIYAFVSQGRQKNRILIEGLNALKVEQDQTLKATEAKLMALRKIEGPWRKVSQEALRARESYDRLLSSVNRMRAVRRLEQQRLSNLQVMHKGTYDTICVGPSRSKKVILGAGVGGLVGLLLAVGLAFLQPRVRLAGDLVRAGVSNEIVLEETKPRRRVTEEEASVLPAALRGAAEMIKQASRSINYDRKSSDPLCVAVTSCNRAVNASYAAGSVAAGLSALLGERVLFLSCDQEPTWLEQALELQEHSGWTDVLAGRVSLEVATQSTEIDGLDLLSVGSAAELRDHLARTKGFTDLLADLRKRYRFVVVGVPSIRENVVLAGLLHYMDGIQLVVRRKRSSRSDVRESLVLINEAGAELTTVWLQS